MSNLEEYLAKTCSDADRAEFVKELASFREKVEQPSPPRFLGLTFVKLFVRRADRERAQLWIVFESAKLPGTPAISRLVSRETVRSGSPAFVPVMFSESIKTAFPMPDNIVAWLPHNMTGEYRVGTDAWGFPRVEFDHEEDAILFKLRWL